MNATSDPGPGAGSRLQRLELYNWGTFHQRVWTFDMAGKNALLTGDIGSGKSTLVDAVTTLLLPANKISYNKAAGAETRERDLRSYVLGHYKTARNETTGTSRPVALRDASNMSVILAVFATGAGEPISLAQVFWVRDVNVGQPERFYVVANADMSLVKEFSGFDNELPGLRRQLRSHGARLHDSFPDYGKDLRRHLSIESDQALDLFHQTVSMKAVDNLNDFVRTHMLEPFETRDRIRSLIGHFDDLTRAHEAVLRARDQLEHLEPLVATLDRYDELTAALADLRRQQDAVPYFFAERSQALAAAEIGRLDERIEQMTQEVERGKQARKELQDKDRELDLAIARAGGDRLVAIDAEVRNWQGWKRQRKGKFDEFNALLTQAELGTVSTAEQFTATRDRIESRRAELGAEAEAVDRQRDAEKLVLDGLKQEADAVNEELRSLQSRRSNIPHASLQLRERLCSDLGIDPVTLPYAGELIQVSEAASEWEGAAERVLHGFALSLLVPDEQYRDVATWIDANHLNARLVYFRVPSRVGRAGARHRRPGQTLLADHLEAKPDSEFRDWLEAELDRRAGYVCAASVDEFRSLDWAVTRQGQTKDRNRHVKDDLRRIDDRRHYVLGWSNEQKIDALVAEASRLQEELARVSTRITRLEGQRSELQSGLNTLVRLDVTRHWDDIDWLSCVTRITKLEEEADRIRSSSDRLRSLTDEKEQVQRQIEAAVEEHDARVAEQGGVVNERRQHQRRLEDAEQKLTDTDAVAQAEQSYPALEQLMAAEQGYALDDISSLATHEQNLQRTLGDRRQKTFDSRGAVSHQVVNTMGRFRAAYPQETLELDSSVEAGDEYRALHDRVAGDDLPRFEQEFKVLLNQNTIREIAGFSAQLRKQAELIRERIGTINRSLLDINYNEGRYIQLVPEPTPNNDIREFRSELSACTDNIVGGDEDDQYSEQRFLQVKAIIDRFKGREGMVDQDRKWTQRVTDVRQWFVVSASERWREDDSEHEHFTDSAGKSGGQKEKLAYTILAASLVYQYRLDAPATRGKAFRFVVIDEAFGRGSEVSTRYALDLFTRLGLQLLIVTPLQKIHVIEPHVSSVGFVDNVDGDYSRLQCLTITDYRHRRSQVLHGATN